MGNTIEVVESLKVLICSSETNLKPREALVETVNLQDDIEKLSNFDGRKIKN